MLQIRYVDCTEAENNDLEKVLQKYCSTLSAKWKKAHRAEDFFLNSNQSWLVRQFNWPQFITICPQQRSVRKPFEHLSKKKNRK